MRRAFIFFTLLCVVAVLAACAPAYDEGRRTNDERQTTVVAATVTPVPTLTATPLPTATAIPTITPTPTRTLTPAEAAAAKLPTLGALTWRADGDKIILGDGVATLDPKTSSLRWDSQNHFASLNNFLKADASPQDRAALASWMKALKEQGVHFITFPDSHGRKEIPPYVVILTADGGDIKMIPARKGTADFVYDAKAEKILGVFPDGSGYYFVNPDGSFDLTPLQNQAEAIAAKLRKDGVIQHPIPANADIIEKAVKDAILIHPWGVTPKEINDFIIARTSRDFEKHFNETWGKKVGVTYEEVMAAVLAKSPKEVFDHITIIKPSLNPTASFWGTDGGWGGLIGIADDHTTYHEYLDPYHPRGEEILIKECSVANMKWVW